MLEQSFVDLIGIAYVAQISNFERGPKKSANTTGIVSPRQAGSVFQFAELQIPYAPLFDLAEGCFFAESEVCCGPAFFLRDGVEEILCLSAGIGMRSRGRLYHSITALA